MLKLIILIIAAVVGYRYLKRWIGRKRLAFMLQEICDDLDKVERNKKNENNGS